MDVEQAQRETLAREQREELARLRARVAELEQEHARDAKDAALYRKMCEIARKRRGVGCACEIDEDGETLLARCEVHADREEERYLAGWRAGRERVAKLADEVRVNYGAWDLGDKGAQAAYEIACRARALPEPKPRDG